MARKALINKARRKPKFSTRRVLRCELCGRPHAGHAATDYQG